MGQVGDVKQCVDVCLFVCLLYECVQLSWQEAVVCYRFGWHELLFGNLRACILFYFKDLEFSVN